MTGAVPAAVLAAYYESADVFVCASEHEGFCVPIVEAMAKGVPVVAYDSAAVGETIGSGGLVLAEKSPIVVAAAVDRVSERSDALGAPRGRRSEQGRGALHAGERQAMSSPPSTRRRTRRMSSGSPEMIEMNSMLDTKYESRFTHVHQVLPSLHVADASGAHSLHARDALRAAGYRSELFVDHVDPALSNEAKSFDELDAFVAPGKTAIVYQLAVGSRLVGHLIARKEPLDRQLSQSDPGELLLEVGSRLARSRGRRSVATPRVGSAHESRRRRLGFQRA